MPKPLNLTPLIQRCVNGDSEAWVEFTKYSSPIILRAIRSKAKKLSVLLSKSDIDEILQKTLVYIWRGKKLKTLQKKDSLIFWLTKIAQNKLVDFLRARGARKKTESNNNIEQVPISLPRNLMQKQEMEKELSSFINSLPFKQRRIGTLNLLHDLGYKQIAGILNMPLGTVSSAIKRIRTALKQYIAKKYE